MKKTLLALALVAASAGAFACSGPSCAVPTVATSGNASVSGAISNSINASATVGSGVGTSFSSAWSGASSAATASVAGSGSATIVGGAPCNPSVTSANATGVINGSTTTDVYGGAYNTSSGTGTGFANATGWSDAGSSAKFTAVLPGGLGSVTTSGSIDTGHPTYVGFGPDISVNAEPNTAVMAEGQASGVFNAKVSLGVTNLNGAVTGTVSDVKSTSDYAATFLTPVTGTATGTGTGASAMDAGSKSNVNAAGSFLVNSTVVGNVTPL